MIHALHHSADVAALRRRDPDIAGTLVKGLLILQTFQRNPRPHANSELAERLGLPRPTVSRLCRTLVELGYLDRDERSDRYFIGPAAVALGYPYIAAIPARAEARPALQALANDLRGAASIGVAMGMDLVYVDSCSYQRGTLARPDVGAMRSVANTAMGRAWLAELGEAERHVVLARLRRERPDQMERCEAGIEHSLAIHKRLGFSVNLGDAGLGVLAVGVASRIRQGSRALLFNCAVQGTRIDERELVERVGPRLVEMVRQFERCAGLF